MAKFLRIAQWNANGLVQHKDEVQLFLQQNKIDTLLVSETHFTTKTHFRIPQYHTYYTNHPDGTAHAGTAILVKQKIQHYELSQYAPDLLQATSICVRTFPFEMTVSVVYSPPKYNLKKEQYKTFFNTLGPRFMAGGDFNSKHTAWGSRITTTKGRVV
jgi:exonuclease III